MFGRLHALPVVTQFLATYPEVSAGLRLTDRVAHFLDDQVDVALRIGALPDSRLVATRLGEVRPLVCASPAYLAARGVPVRPADVAQHSAIAFDGVASASAWTFRTDDQEAPVPFRARLSVNTIDGAIAAALAGAGLVRALSYQVNEHVRSGRLQVVLQDFEPLPRPVHLVYAQQARLPLKLRAFVDFAVPRLREQVGAATL